MVFITTSTPLLLVHIIIASYSCFFALKEMDPYVTGSVSSQVGAEVESSVGVASGSSMGQASQSQPTYVSSEVGAEIEASVKLQLREYLTEFNDMLKEYVKLIAK